MDIYGMQCDIDQNLDPANMQVEGVSRAFTAFMVPEEDFKGLSIPMEEALKTSTTLLVNEAPKTGRSGGPSMAL